jgi:hypothetical protein
MPAFVRRADRHTFMKAKDDACWTIAEQGERVADVLGRVSDRQPNDSSNPSVSQKFTARPRTAADRQGSDAGLQNSETDGDGDGDGRVLPGSQNNSHS